MCLCSFFRVLPVKELGMVVCVSANAGSVVQNMDMRDS